MSKHLTTLNDDWLELDEFNAWLKKWIDTKTATCSICKHSFDISNMGKSAIVSYSKGQKYLEKKNNRNSISTLFVKNSAELSKDAEAKPSTEIPCSSNHRSCKTTTNLTSVMIKSAVTIAEILWCLKSILSHSSFRSFENVSNLFSFIFSDTDFAKSVSVGKNKMYILYKFCHCPIFQRFIIRETEVFKIRLLFLIMKA